MDQVTLVRKVITFDLLDFLSEVYKWLNFDIFHVLHMVAVSLGFVINDGLGFKLIHHCVYLETLLFAGEATRSRITLELLEHGLYVISVFQCHYTFETG